MADTIRHHIMGYRIQINGVEIETKDMDYIMVVEMRVVRNMEECRYRVQYCMTWKELSDALLDFQKNKLTNL